MSGLDVITAALIFLVVGAVITALIARYRTVCGYVASVIVLIVSIWIAMVAWQALTRGPIHSVYVIPFLNIFLPFTVDGLGAIFLLITSLVATCATLFSVQYMSRYPRYNLASYYPLLLLFFACVIGEVSTHNMLLFLVFWEVMALTSWGLIIFEKHDPEVRRAGWIYFVAIHAATACILVAIIILYLQTPTKSFELSQMRQVMANWLVVSPGLAHITLGLLALGFATKAGILPFGFWLPHAHPAAPSPFSAVLSGLMVKMGVHGLLVTFVMLLPLSSASTVGGIVIALLGTISIFVATLTALQQRDSKRLLAFHTIGQMGYIWLGLGTGLALLRISPALATVALIAGLFHMINHAAFKSLLFLNAGAALYRTGTRDMDKAGGLIRIMPVTAITAIIASLSIAGIPGFNGFASKWLIFASSIMAGIKLPLFVFLAIIAIFISAVTLASFMKFLGMLFLGKLHVGPEVEHREVPLTMTVSQVLTAIPCVLFGVLPILVMKYLYTAVSSTLPAGFSPTFASLFGRSLLNATVSLPGSSTPTGIWGPLVILIAFAGCLALAYLISRMGGAKTREVPMWLCGEEHSFEEVRYPVHSFLLPFNRFFASLYPAHFDTDVSSSGHSDETVNTKVRQ